MMVHVERAEELTTYERMAWSARPVWNRRPAQDRRRGDDQHLALAGRRSRTARRRCRNSHRRAEVARQESLVANFALDGQKETLRNEGTHQRKGGYGR